jgi:GNAT superfamily N-acetyltransferase
MPTSHTAPNRRARRPPAIRAPIAGPSITYSYAPSEADFAAIFRALDRETAAVTGPCLIEPFALLLRDDEGAVTGGLWGRFVYSWLVIEMLFVPEPLRGTGAGTALMRMAETAARAHGCTGLQLTRLDFQAPSFYQNRGFTIDGVQNDVPPGHACYYLSKRLPPMPPASPG